MRSLVDIQAICKRTSILRNEHRKGLKNEHTKGLQNEHMMGFVFGFFIETQHEWKKGGLDSKSSKGSHMREGVRPEGVAKRVRARRRHRVGAIT